MTAGQVQSCKQNCQHYWPLFLLRLPQSHLLMKSGNVPSSEKWRKYFHWVTIGNTCFICCKFNYHFKWETNKKVSPQTRFYRFGIAFQRPSNGCNRFPPLTWWSRPEANAVSSISVIELFIMCPPTTYVRLDRSLTRNPLNETRCCLLSQRVFFKGPKPVDNLSGGENRFQKQW